MLKPQDFTRTSYGVLKWSWRMPGDNGKLRIDFLDWQQPGRILSGKSITDEQFENHYMREGLPIPGAPGVPALIQVTEECGDQVSNQFQMVLMDRGMRIPIRWKKEKCGDVFKITVYYPRSEIVRPETYPDKMLYFLVCASGETVNTGARLYLPRPGEDRSQEFWFDGRAGYSIYLRIQEKLSFGCDGMFETDSVFCIEQLQR